MSLTFLLCTHYYFVHFAVHILERDKLNCNGTGALCAAVL